MRGLAIALVLILGAVGAWIWLPTSKAPQQGASAEQAPAGANPQRGQGGGNANAILVVTAPVREADVQHSFEALGTAMSNEAVTITSKVTGIIKSINFTEGQTVKKGDVLVELDDRELKATLAAAVADVSTAKQTWERSAQLLSSGSAAKAKVDDLQTGLLAAQARADAAKARLADLSIAAPFSGQLGIRRISVGALVTAGTMITTLDDISVIKLDFSIPETLMSRVKMGSTVSAKGDALPGKMFEGVVKTVDSRIDPITRAIEVIAEVPNDQRVIQSGMLLNVTMALDNQAPMLLIPEEALVPEGTSQFVFMVEDGKAVRKEITIGERQRGAVEVRKGLEKGMQIIVGGLQRIRPGVAVRVGSGGRLEGS
jgi:membrane fusion protein (multidrug efflux system)